MNEVLNVASGFSLPGGFTIGLTIGLVLLVAIILAKAFRTVVEPNEVHIVQGRKSTTTYGKAPEADVDDDDESDNIVSVNNSYYAWPAWWPRIGVQVRVLPLSVFDQKLTDYEAYDIGKVPFKVDVVAFFRISNPAVAAKRTKDERELQCQLESILQGATRTILAKHEIEDIMMERSTFGKMFTVETEGQLKAWGVSNVKNIELMDIRDGIDSRVVSDIMAKKESVINRESRVVIADNTKQAETAEIEARQVVEVREQQAQQLVGERTAEKVKLVGVANEVAQQEIKEQAKTTAEKDMAVKLVENVRGAEINREVQVVKADEDRQTFVIRAEGEKQKDIITAEGEKQQTVLVAEGILVQQLKDAEGILAVGTSTAEASRLLEMATVSPQLELADGIGENEPYQDYMVRIENVHKDRDVGVENAKALQDAGIKMIINSGDAPSGLDNILDVFSANGGTQLAAMAEALNQTDAGAAIAKKLGFGGEESVTPTSTVTVTPRKVSKKKAKKS